LKLFSHLSRTALIGPKSDFVWLWGTPLLVLLFALPFLQWDVLFRPLSPKHDVFGVLLGTIIMSHLVIVFFRSHVNQVIFKQFPVRFIVVPVVLFVSMLVSPWALVVVSVVATWWDVYHSSLQTFGIGRLFDMKVGNSALVGRRLDFWLSLLIYVGPVVAGATLMAHVEDFAQFNEVNVQWLADLPAVIFSHQSVLSKLVFFFGVPFVLVYLFCYWRLFQQGYRFSVQKVCLFAFTALVSVWCWGFNRFGEAFFVMNVFHALQYFAIVWHFEKQRVCRCFGLVCVSRQKVLAFVGFVGVAVVYGLWAELEDAKTWVLAVSLTYIGLILKTKPVHRIKF